MTGRKPRNAQGYPVTATGIDRRAFNSGRPKKVIVHYFVRYMPHDVRPWHVMSPGTVDEPVRRMGRYRTAELAQRALERLQQ